MKRIALLIALLTSCAVLGCQKGQSDQKEPETLVRGGYDEDAMEAAIARARSEVDDFIADFQQGQSQDYSVKAPIEDEGEVEHFWLTDITYDGESFTGNIGNDPGIVSNVEFGQKYTIAKGEISDWMYFRDGKMYGNYTMRPLLDSMPEEEAARFRQMFAAP